MSAPIVRLARLEDVDELVALRSDFTFEDFDAAETTIEPTYEEDCRAFLADAITSGRWHIWIGEVDGRLVSHAFVALVDKVPRPIRESARIAYLTNVYTQPAYRGHGIGSALVRRAQAVAKQADVELMIVWPSDDSVDFYERAGFERSAEPLIWRSTAGP